MCASQSFNNRALLLFSLREKRNSKSITGQFKQNEYTIFKNMFIRNLKQNESNMSLLKILFGHNENNHSFESRLHQKITSQLPNAPEQEILLVACLSGLLARVAYCDFKLHENETEIIKSALSKWSDLEEQDINAITQISIEEVQDLSGLENHKYCHPLIDILTIEQRYKILESLFAVAAADGEVEHNETEEIRQVANSLRLEHHYFISAKATVLESLKVLKS